MNRYRSGIPAEYVVLLNMNGLHGRMLRLPAPANRKREILFIYGQHGALESVYGMAKVLNEFGGVTVPDLPGMGGMESFYRLGEMPSLDTMAAYLASFVKLRYRRRRLTLVGQEFGFLVVTRMLQRYPEIASKVDVLISLNGFAHAEDFNFSLIRRSRYLLGARILARKWPSRAVRGLALNASPLRWYYRRVYSRPELTDILNARQIESSIAHEVRLWRINEARTFMRIWVSMLRADNCRIRVNLPVWHIANSGDPRFNRHMVEQHLSVIYSHFHGSEATLSPLLLSGMLPIKHTSVVMPRKIKRLLHRSTPS